MTINVSKPSRYCRRCSYVLDGIESRECPECGRPFDPDDKRTFRRKPRLTFWGRTWRIAAVFVLLCTIGAGWLYRIHTIEQNAMDWITEQGGTYNTGIYGPPWLTDWLIERDLPTIETVVEVDLSRRPITDAGLVHLRKLSSVRQMSLKGTQITDEGLAHLQGMNGLGALALSETKTTDAGLAHLCDLTELTYLTLSETEITDAGLFHMRRMNKMEYLYLTNTRVSDAGMVHLRGMTNMRQLFLTGSAVTDAGLANLTGMTRMRFLGMHGTQLTTQGIAELQKALPKLQTGY